MFKHLSTALLFICLLDCKNDHPSQTESSNIPLVLETTILNRTEGDCDSDSYESKCAEISLKYPEVKSGPVGLQQNVATWTNDFLVSLLDPMLEMEGETPLGSAINGFIEMHKEMTAEMPDMPGHYTIEVVDTVLLRNEQYLTLRMDAYSYTGGVHPNATAAIATFDLNSGKRLRPVDFVKDLEKLHAAAEIHFKEAQKEAFDEGFEFSDDWPFVLAENVGLTTEGLFFCYVPYEVSSYAMGFTEFVIPYDELEKL